VGSEVVAPPYDEAARDWRQPRLVKTTYDSGSREQPVDDRATVELRDVVVVLWQISDDDERQSDAAAAARDVA